MKSHILFCLYIAVFCACSTSEKKPRTQPNASETFANYLLKQFQIPIPKESHYFIVINQNTCVGCKKGGLAQAAKLHSRSDITVVTSINKEEQKKWLGTKTNPQILIDSTGLIERINLPLPSNSAIIQTNLGKIVKIHNFDYSNYESVFNSVFQNSNSILIY